MSRDFLEEPGIQAALKNIKGCDGLKWPQTMDQYAWAKAFTIHVTYRPSIATDEDTMAGWFSNAIMAGYDGSQGRLRDVKEEERRLVREREERVIDDYKLTGVSAPKLVELEWIKKNAKYYEK